MFSLRQLRLLYAQPHVREFLAWCLPALLLGALLRLALLWQVPHGLFHAESPDFLATPDHLLFQARSRIDFQRPFLVPLLFTVPFLLHLPALLFIPLFQNLLGLAVIFLVGLFCRLWFARWKLFLIPLTVLVAINPFLLWYERALMAETVFLFCTLLLAVAGTLYTVRASHERFLFLCIALVLESGARAEGKLFFLFGLILVALLHWRTWLLLVERLAVLLLLAGAMFYLTGASRAGLLLYTSVARLTPMDLKMAPGFDPYIAPVRSDLQSRWGTIPSFPKAQDRRLVAEAVERYLAENQAVTRLDPHRGMDTFCLKVALEACRHNLLALPNLIYHKFRATCTQAPSGLFDGAWLFDHQHSAYGRALESSGRLSVGLTGQHLQTAHDFAEYVDHHYGSVPWFNDWTKVWLRVVNHFRFADSVDSTRRSDLPSIYFGVPLYFVVAAIGLIFTIFRRGPLQPVFIAWGVSLFALFLAIAFLGNTKARFRFVFEPFWFIYIALLFDTLLLSLQTLTCRVTEPLPTDTIEPATP